LRRHALARRPIELGDHHRGSLLRQPAGIRLADAVTATGDDRDTALQSFHRRKYSGSPHLTLVEETTDGNGQAAAQGTLRLRTEDAHRGAGARMGREVDGRGG